MKIINHNTYPIYEADQVLTSDHLNEMFNYLEEQERLTRAKLLGSGIVCGLEISLDTVVGKLSVVISKGIGVTSQGFLIALGKEDNSTITNGLKDINVYSYYKEYIDPINLDDSISSNDTIYPFFLKSGSQIKLFELHDRNEAGFELLSNFSTTEESELEDYVVLLYLECYDKELKNCIENDCNEKGVERTFTLRKLLVSKTACRDIICAEEAALTAPKSEAEIDNYVNARYYLKPTNLPRLQFLGSNTETPNLFISHYAKYVMSMSDRVQDQLAKSASFLDPILSNNLLKRGRFNKLMSLHHLININTNGLQMCHIQYFYDFLCDIIETYNELVEAVFDMTSLCCPPLDRFPKHLRLGDLSGVERCIPSPYRMTYNQSPIHNHGHQQKEVVNHLLQKLSLLISQFRLPTEHKIIKITPSAQLSDPLSKRAIPYYYNVNQEFLKYWNYEYSRKCRLTHNLSYHSNLYEELNVGETPDFVLNPLRYGLNKHDFFRIEGHVCRKYDEAIKEIQTIRDKNNLPFDVIALKLSRDAKGTTFDEATCNFKDLKILCEAWKSELQCLLGKVIKKLSSVNYRDAIVMPVAVDPVVGASTATLDTVGLTAVGLSTAAPLFGATADFDRVILGDSSSRIGVAYSSLDNSKTYASAVYQPRVFTHVSEQIEGKVDTLGYTLKKAMAVESDICKYDVKGTEFLQNELMAIPEYETLNYQDNLVAFIHPLSLSVAVLDFSNAMDKDCHEMELEEIEKKLIEMNRRAALYTKDLNNYKKQSFRRVNIDYETIIQIISVLSTNCSFATLKEIYAEMERRKQEILRMNLFSEYLKKNPGIDHKSGVPKGGTFILVYADEERTNVDVKPGRQSNNPDSFIVTGKIKDFQGEGLIGATILIKGTTIGTITDIDGSFQLTVPKGTQTLVISYVGFQTEEVVVIGPSTVDITLGQDSTTDNTGKVIADFFLPYLCCSDCPPVAYVFTEGEETIPEDEVALDITKRIFCSPTTDTPHIFIVTPEDGTVTGEGVVPNDATGFSFDANQIDLEGNTFKTVSFKVNDIEVPITVRVVKEPTANFIFEVVWEEIDGSGILPVLRLKIKDFDSRFDYEWNIYIVEGDDKKLVIADKHGDNPGNPALRTFILEKFSKPELIFTIELTARNEDCSKTGSETSVIPPFTFDNPIAFLLLENGDPMGVQDDNHYSFPTRSDSKIMIQASPVGSFLTDDPFNVLGVKKVSADENSVRYEFSPFRKPAGKYPLTYKTDTGNEQLLIVITPSVSSGSFTGLLDLRALGNDTRIIDVLGTDNEGFINTVTIANDLNSRLIHPAISRSVAEGSFNTEFVKKMEPATKDVSSKIIAAKSPSSTKNNSKQNTMLELYEKQVTMLLEMVVVQKDDLSPQSELAKMSTKINKQLKTMKEAGVKVNVGKRMEKAIVKARKALKDKPLAKKRFNGLIETINS